MEEREIDPIFYERTYYLEPEEGGKKPYALLLKALNKKGLSAVATIAIRSKEQLCVLRPHDGTIMLETLYYPDEIRLERSVDLSEVKVSDRELEMAFTLIDIFRKPFDPSEYQDHYREALAQLIEAKLEGKQVEEEPESREAKVFDLADALRRSVEAARKGAKAKPAARAPARQARSRRRTRKVWMSPVGTKAEGVLEQLAERAPRVALTVEGHKLSVTNLDKVLWPGSGRIRPLTKRDLLRYLARVSPWLLPHLKGRPMFVTRYPDGITGKSFYQKHWDHPPEFVRTVTIYSSHTEGDSDYIICENLPTLLWLGQMGGLELHPWFSRVDPFPDGRSLGRKFSGSEANLKKSLLNYPDFVVFDLDPYQYSGREGKGEEPELHRKAFKRTRDLALRLRDLLAELGLKTYVKTSGRTGLHLYLPILRKFDYETVRGMAETIGRYAQQRWPDEVTLEWSVKRRTGKIFFDYNQNVRGKSLASIFSPRRHPLGTVSMPVEWEQLERIYPTDFTLRNVPDVLEQQGDPWADILQAKQDLAALLEQRTAG